jgi:hypothetical protein
MRQQHVEMQRYLSLMDSETRLDWAFPAGANQTLGVDRLLQSCVTSAWKLDGSGYAATRSTTLLDAPDWRCMANATALPARALSNTHTSGFQLGTA